MKRLTRKSKDKSSTAAAAPPPSSDTNSIANIPTNTAGSSALSSQASALVSESPSSNFHNIQNHDPTVVERVRVRIKNAHVFKLPPRPTSGGWRGADWHDKVWQGDAKVVERGDQTAVLLVDRTTENIFAVCPIREGSVDRCVDSSRYFVLRIENDVGRHMFIGMAFNERNDAFDFNTALEDSRREREMESMPLPVFTGPSMDYSLKEGQKIHVNIPKINGEVVGGGGGGDGFDEDGDRHHVGSGSKAMAKRKKKPAGGGGGGFLKPPSKDTPSRAMRE